MALRQVRVGGIEDAYQYDDAVFNSALETDHTVKVHQVPADGEDVLRLEDVEGIVGESMWPVGSVFLSVVVTNPSVLIGFGVWVRIAEGQFLVGFKTGDPHFDPVENTGGNKYHTHSVDVVNTPSTGPSAATEVDNNIDGSTVDVASDAHTHDVDPAVVTSGNNSTLQPFFVVYVWKRIA